MVCDDENDDGNDDDRDDKGDDDGGDDDDDDDDDDNDDDDDDDGDGGGDGDGDDRNGGAICVFGLPANGMYMVLHIDLFLYNLACVVFTLHHTVSANFPQDCESLIELDWYICLI